MSNSDFVNIVAQKSIETFNKLPKTGKPDSKNQWTVLSTIVKEQNSQFEVISLGTGTKCIGQSKMSPNGDILNDSHGEIICRRSFLLYLYSQIELALQNKSSILRQSQTNNKTFEIVEGVSFHLFSTHAPCGDATIFPKDSKMSEIDDFGDVLNKDSDFNLLKRKHTTTSDDKNESQNKKLKTNEEISDIFRTGAKCLNKNEDPLQKGANYHITGVVRTKPGRGDPTLSVSCSDKIAKWGHLGIQGALLSQFLIKPIFLTSFILAKNTPFCKNALERAFYTRFKNNELKFDNKLQIFQADVNFEFNKIEEKIPCSSSISWFKNEISVRNDRIQVEISVDGKKQGVTKKILNSPKGRVKICKMEIFKTYLAIAKKLDIFENCDNLNILTYKKCKKLSLDYQKKWDDLKNNFFKSWTRKNENFLDFKPK